MHLFIQGTHFSVVSLQSYLSLLFSLEPKRAAMFLDKLAGDNAQAIGKDRKPQRDSLIFFLVAKTVKCKINLMLEICETLHLPCSVIVCYGYGCMPGSHIA